MYRVLVLVDNEEVLIRGLNLMSKMEGRAGSLIWAADDITLVLASMKELYLLVFKNVFVNI